MDWCSTTNGWTAYFGGEATKLKFAILLSAQASGQSITIQTGTDKQCPDGARNRIRNVYLN
jgi:hypothetical protein